MAGRETPDPSSDEDLIQACNDGNTVEATRAFDALYKRHKDYVIRIAMRFVWNHDMALDVLQETFTFLLRKFPPSGNGLTLTAQLTTFLYPVAKNNAITLVRKSVRFPASDDLQPDDLPAIPAQESGAIAQVLDDLSDERREVIMLRFVDDMSLQEISTVLRIPLGTVKSRLHLAIKQLRNSAQVKELLIS